MDDDRGQPLADVLSLPRPPDAIELRHLRAFVAVADELNFGRAASRLYLSQPALSRQIRTLERLIGCDLLRRSTHRVELTLAGEALLNRARQLLRDLDDAVLATRSVGGELVERVTRLWEPLIELADAQAGLRRLRAAYEALHAQFEPPPEIGVSSVNADGVPCLLLTPGPERPATLLFLHGGGYTLGSAFGHRPLVGALTAAAGTGALVPEYRLAPEHPFPAALDDAVTAYLWMLGSGTNPRDVTVAGDSSGGGLALSLLIRLKQRGLPLPGRALLMCPWLDLGRAIAASPSAVVPPEAERRGTPAASDFAGAAAAYLAGHPADDPVVSPLTADLAGLPPMLIQAAAGDAVLEEAQRLTDHARGHGVDVTLELYPVDTHVFQLFWSFLPEAADALHQAGRFASDAGDGLTGHDLESGTAR
ncbi:alpha/beta hydrolase fold domain-containing protein [Microbispora sp. NPDC049125]|uniref:alpha/beta hydrolase fold domain-containing protein n=1 Tax=Microbispora sp. NPDC049125 TaxID=3154929 RepID=UPI003465BF55